MINTIPELYDEEQFQWFFFMKENLEIDIFNPAFLIFIRE